MSRPWASALSVASALVIALLVAGLLVRMTLLPLLTADPVCDGLREAINQYRTIAEGRDRLRQALAEAPPAADEAAGRLALATDALAQAEMQMRLSAMAGRFAVTVTSEEPMSTGDGAATGRILLRLDLAGSLAGLQGLFHAIESDRTAMAIARLDLRRAGDGGATPPNPPLTAEVTVAAWRTVSP